MRGGEEYFLRRKVHETNRNGGIIMSITYREAKRILEKQEEARDVINSLSWHGNLGEKVTVTK